VYTYSITKEAKERELNIIKRTLHNNKYKPRQRYPNQHKHKKITDPQQRKTKWAAFTYNGKETKKIMKLFKETQIKVAF
jgi:hypothetical protein